MKLSISVNREDIEFLDGLIESKIADTRSQAVRKCIEKMKTMSNGGN